MKTEVTALLAEMLLFGMVPIAFGIWQIREVNKERRKRQQERDQQAHQHVHHTDTSDTAE